MINSGPQHNRGNIQKSSEFCRFLMHLASWEGVVSHFFYHQVMDYGRLRILLKLEGITNASHSSLTGFIAARMEQW